MKKFRVRLDGVSPIIFHNGQLANPNNYYVEQIKAITKKKVKSQMELVRLADLEWVGSLYLNAQKQIDLPGHVIEGALINAAKKLKSTAKFKSAVYLSKAASFSYKGPTALEELQANPDFRLEVMVVIQGRRILRTRPIFKEWSAEAEICFLEGQISKTDVLEALTLAGLQVGLGDWRPKYGRFTVMDLGD
jgi:hypothetical protein